MRVQQYLDVALRRKWIVVITTAISLVAAILINRLATPVYMSSTMVRIAQVQDVSSGRYGDLQYSERVMNTYVHVLTSRPYLEAVTSHLGLDMGPLALAEQVSVEVLPNSELLTITAEDESPQVAEAIANKLGDFLVDEGQRLYVGSGKSAREILQEELTEAGQQLHDMHAIYADLMAASPQDQSLTEEALGMETRIEAQEQLYAMLIDSYDAAELREAMQKNSITVVAKATAASHPSKPRVKLNLALGLFLGMTLGVAGSFLVENLDPRIRTADKLEAASDLLMLAEIPRLPSARARMGILALRSSSEHSPFPEVDMLASVLLATASDSQDLSASILITGPGRGVGTSTLAANLANELARAGRKVVLVDAALSHPGLHALFGIANRTGLANALLVPHMVDEAIRATHVPGLELLPSGGPAPNPQVLINSENAREVFGLLGERADFVIVDSPPVSEAGEVLSLANLVDAVLLVVGCDITTLSDLHQALHLLKVVGASLWGIVLNHAPPADRELRSGVRRLMQKVRLRKARGPSAADKTLAHAGPRSAGGH